MITHHEDIWRRLRHHDKLINEMKNKNNSNNKNNNDNDDTGESAGNKTQNARLERHYVYDERRDDNSKMKDLGTFLYFMLCHLIAG